MPYFREMIRLRHVINRVIRIFEKTLQATKHKLIGWNLLKLEGCDILGIKTIYEAIKNMGITIF